VQKVSAELKKGREAAGLSQAEIGRRIGVTQAMVSKLENAEDAMGTDTAKRYAEVLKMDPWALFLGHTLEVIERGAEKGYLSGGEVAAKTTRLLSMTHESGGITDEQLQGFIVTGQRLVEQACVAAEESRTTGDLIGAVGR